MYFDPLVYDQCLRRAMNNKLKEKAKINSITSVVQMTSFVFSKNILL